MRVRLILALFGSMWHLKGLCMSTPSPLLKRLLILIYQWCQDAHQSAIEWNARCPSAPCFPHGVKGIFISGGATIGKNCVIFQQVTIGSNALPGSKSFGCPTIGDSCYIGAGAKIIGKVRVGDHVRIGANAVVYHDVPDNSVVLCGSQTVTKAEPLDNRYFSLTRKGGWSYYDNEAWISVNERRS